MSRWTRVASGVANHYSAALVNMGLTRACWGPTASLFGAATMTWIERSDGSEPLGTQTPRTWCRSFWNRWTPGG